MKKERGNITQASKMKDIVVEGHYSKRRKIREISEMEKRKPMTPKWFLWKDLARLPRKEEKGHKFSVSWMKKCAKDPTDGMLEL